jgi:hypothetical protein
LKLKPWYLITTDLTLDPREAVRVYDGGYQIEVNFDEAKELGLGSLSRAFRTRGATLAFVSLFCSDDMEVHCYRARLCLITGDQLVLVYEGEHGQTSQATFN